MTLDERETLREIHERILSSTGIPITRYNPKTLGSLVRRGLILLPPEDRPSLPPTTTDKGKAEYERIMATGNGPEALKELFRF